MLITRPILSPIRRDLSTNELWKGSDGGLIACWERGREMATKKPELAKAALAGELVPLPWKGGLEAAIKTKKKYGTMRYLAMWQGLRGENMSIDTSIEYQIFCQRFHVTVTFTADKTKYENV